LCPERKYVPHCHQCSEMSGIPCTGDKCKHSEALQHLPECKIIHYGPKIDHVGFDIKYPQCPHTKTGMVNPPQFNPLRQVVNSNARL
jgi:hypothetical protein